jgi:FixJ family two-component response regulator
VGGLGVSEVPVIAVVDDDVSIRRSLRRLLQSAGYAVATFGSAGDFLDALPRTRAACLILDIHLVGGTGGFELQERLLTDGVAVPVVFITAHDDAPTRERVERSGAAGHLWKPFEDHALLDAIRKAVGRDQDPIDARHGGRSARPRNQPG